ncbi:ABC transporter permease [Bifidobacterium favimelis]|uniref:ABC transporter permease n=1 Tax=Bifidobacterium favimelis TaxID=3122979 RepID=A0ABU8ZM57_9BIFI
MWHTAQGRFSLVVLGFWLAVSLVSIFWTPVSLWETDGYRIWRGPSRSHILGTDGTGADILSWLMAGSGTNLVISLLAVLFSALLGLVLVAGMISPHLAVSQGVVVLVDALISLPTVLLALILAVPLGPGMAVVIVACGFGYGLNLARIVRPQALLAAGSDYVRSALSDGVGRGRIFLTHILPNLAPVLSVQLSMSAGTAVLAESGLTYLGIGVPPGLPSWGHSLTTSVKFINIYPLTVIWPGLVVTLAVVALNLFGDSLRDAADPVANPALREAVAKAARERAQVAKGRAAWAALPGSGLPGSGLPQSGLVAPTETGPAEIQPDGSGSRRKEEG